MELVGFEPTAEWVALCAAHNSVSEKPLSSVLVRRGGFEPPIP